METKRYSIGGRQYAMLVPPPTKSIPLANRVIKQIAEALPVLLAQVGEGMPVAELGAKFATALQSIDPLEMFNIFMDAVYNSHLVYCREHTQEIPISTKETFDRHFGEFRSDTYPVCIWVVWQTVQDFLSIAEALPPTVSDKKMKG